jgi:hypothetical protein
MKTKIISSLACILVISLHAFSQKSKPKAVCSIGENSRKRASNFLISFQEYKTAFLIVKFDLKK